MTLITVGEGRRGGIILPHLSSPVEMEISLGNLRRAKGEGKEKGEGEEWGSLAN